MSTAEDMLSNSIFDKPILSIDDVANLLQLSEKTIRRKMADKDIPYRKIGGKVRFIRTEIVEWIDRGNK